MTANAHLNDAGEPAVILEAVDAVRIIRLNRPGQLNAMNPALMNGLIEAVAEVAADREARALILTGSGRGFCAGADLVDGVPGEGDTPGDRTRSSMMRVFNPAVLALYDLDMPVITAVNGIAAGGGAGLAMVGDLIIAGESAQFIQVFVPNLGLVPDVSSTWNLPRRLGRSRALGLAMLGSRLGARQALDWGLIWDCVADDKLMDRAVELARHCGASPTGAFRATRRLIDSASENTLAEQLQAEADAQRIRANSPNFAEGVRAFQEKRKPEFTRD
ncbi:MAG: enoyl-CoA hydratase/isomerase family protein [Gammaproteobacteria bacterium AqS3]|nr:enoyl-CoA hydratase/isomerase family protein [Gammaproteobacteria bacterium AqS3]